MRQLFFKKPAAFLMFTFVLLTQKGYALEYNPYQVFQKGRVDLNLSGSYFKTDANFGSDGSKQNLFGSNYLQNIEVKGDARWELIEDLGVIIGGNIANAESSDVLTTRRNSTFNKLDIGADFLFWNSDIHEAFFRMIYTHPLEKADMTTDSVFNSDGVSEIKPEAVFRFNFGSWYPFGQIGANFRSEGLSTLLTYAAGFEARFSQLGLGTLIKGRASISDDSQTGNPMVRDAVNARVNGGSKKYFSVNPNSTDLEAYFIFSVNRHLQMKFFGDYTLIGSNSAVGYSVGAAVNFNFNMGAIGGGSSSVHSEPTYQSSDVSRDVTPQDFKEDTNDGVNQEYFKPVQPQQKNYIQQLDQQPAAQPPAKIKKDNQSEAIKNQLNEMEYTIQLKQKKKKKNKK